MSNFEAFKELAMDMLKALWASKAVKSAVISLAGAALNAAAVYVGAYRPPPLRHL